MNRVQMDRSGPIVSGMVAESSSTKPLILTFEPRVPEIRRDNAWLIAPKAGHVQCGGSNSGSYVTWCTALHRSPNPICSARASMVFG